MEASPANSAHSDEPRMNTLTTTLPDDIVIEEILPRLPVKSLFRFKCVSNHFLFTISSCPEFANLYLKFSSLLRRHFFGMNPSHEDQSYKFYLLPYQECTTKNDMVELGDGDEVDETRIVDSCNGLVCLYYQEDDDESYVEELERERECYFTLWNPATRQSRDIKSPLGVHMACAYGFGYVPSLDDYRIVASFQTEWRDTRIFRGLYVFSLKSGKWDRLLTGRSEYCSKYGGCWRKRLDRSEDEIKEEEIANKLKRAGVMVGDVIYWAPAKWNRNENIVGFDVVSEKFEEHSCLDWKKKYNVVVLFRLKGCLGLCGYYNNYSGREFWMLKDGTDWNSWQKLFSVGKRRGSFVTISETGKCLVKGRPREQLKLVDLSKEALKCIQLTKSPALVEKAVDHVDSLVSPFGMTKSVEETENFETAEHSITVEQLVQKKREDCPSQSCYMFCSDEDEDEDEDDEDSDNFEKFTESESDWGNGFEDDDDEQDN